MTRVATTVMRDLLTQSPIFTTAQAASAAEVTIPIASRALKQMETNGLIVRVVRGLWAAPRHPHFSPYGVVPFLLRHDHGAPMDETASWSVPIDLGAVDSEDASTDYAGEADVLPASVGGYVSCISALYLHGMISQIPQEIHVTVRSKRAPLRTPVGRYRFHQIAPTLFGGAEPGDAVARFHLATPAKALVDTFYVAVHRGRAFAHLPEIDWPHLRGHVTSDGGRHPLDVSESVARLDAEVAHWVDRIERPRIRAAVQGRWRAVREMMRGEV